jgi:pimeloyl-ACP methyl ester carboxylesterase/tetratricopeptide (TPR) repeat protein
MEKRGRQTIRYLRTSDGVQLAWAEAGAGPLVIKAANWLTHLEYEWESPVWRHWIRFFRGHFRFVRYDERGCGMSDWNVGDLTPSRWDEDLESVVDALQPSEPFALIGISQGAAPCLAYAVRHPERVSRLIFYGGYARGWSRRDMPGDEREYQAIAELAEAGWDRDNASFRQVFTSRFIPGATSEQIDWFNELCRKSTTPKIAAELLRVRAQIDVVDLLARVRTPTLVLHARGDAVCPISEGRLLASCIAGAEFVELDSKNHILLEGEPAWGRFRGAVLEFMGVASAAESRSDRPDSSAEVDDTLDGRLLRALASAPEQTHPGGRLASGRYRVVRLLGQGAQKIVLLVEDTVLARECALSILPDDRMDAGGLDRFRREALAVARLGPHPHVVTIYDLGEEQGRPFIACEYLAGGDLRTALRRSGGSLPIGRALAVARDICRALVLAHGQGVVHRDVKPENVWLSSDGAAKLGDFGLALSVDRSRLTSPGAVIGTASYLAPEQAVGQAVDARADLYALGCVIYELVTGRPPFVGDDFMSVISQHVHATPVSVCERNRAVPPALDRLVQRMLAKTREERPASAAEVLSELERLSTRFAGELAEPEAVGPLDPLTRTRFVGRRAELGQLKASLEQALAGRGSSYAVAGEPGIGKSRLAHELGLYATLRGARVLCGRSTDAGGASPYLPFMEALDACLRELPADAIGPLFAARAPQLARLLPRLVAGFPASAGAAGVTEENDRYVLFQAVLDLLCELAAPAGLLLVLEDLHWADEPSLRLFQHMARHLASSRILVFASFRDVEVDRRHPLRDVLADLRRDRLCEHILLRGLSLDEVRELVGQEALPEELARALQRETEGNPFFLTEVLKHLAEEGRIGWKDGSFTPGASSIAGLGIPEGVRDVIDRRLARLAEPTGRMLRLAAAIGPDFRWDLLVAASDQDEDALLDALDEAIAAQIVRPQSTGREGAYQFVHALIRHTLYETQSGPRQARLHRQIGEALERLHGSALESRLDELAHHYCRASGADAAAKAIGYTISAGDHAAAVLAYEEAVAHYGRALELLSGREPPAAGIAPAAEVHARRAAALAQIGMWEEARQEFEAALAGTPSERRERRAELLVDQAMVCFWSQDVPALRRHASEALEIAESLGLEDLAAGAEGALAAAASADGEVRSGIRSLRQALARGRGRRTGATARGLQMCSLQLYWVGDYEEAIALAQDAAASARAVGDAFLLMAALPQMGLALSGCGRYREALQAFEEARRFGRDHNIGGFHARAIAMSAGIRCDLYDHRGAQSLMEEARDVGRSVGFAPPVLNSGLELLRIHVRRGEVARAEELVQEVQSAVESAVAWHGWLWKMRLAQGRAELALARGEWEEAERLAMEVVARCRASGRVKYEVEGLLARARALDGLGRAAEAVADRAAAVALVRRTADPAAFVRAAGELLRVRPDERLAIEARETAGRIVAALPDGEVRRTFALAPPIAALLS